MIEIRPTKPFKSLKLAVTCVGASASIALFGALASPQGPASQPLTAQIAKDASPPDREGPLGGFANIVDRVSPSVVSIATSKAISAAFQDPYGEELRRFFGLPRRPSPQQQPGVQRPQGLGSGVILSPEGYIVTNNHVVKGADEILVSLSDDRTPYKAEVIGQDPKTDLAVLKIDADHLPSVTIADSSVLKVGDTVLAIGNPFGLSQTVTSGIVSALGRSNMDIVDYENFIQTDASINPGNSGGALVDNKGRLVGINTAILSKTGGNVGIGFAIPINMVMNIADQLISDGEIQRGYLGVLLGDLSRDLAQALQVDAQGVLVNQVLPNTPAEESGLRDGDVIVSVDGAEVKDMQKTRLYVSSKRPGTQLKLRVLRDGKERNVNVTIGRLPSEGFAANSSTIQPNRRKPAELIEGVTVQDLEERGRQELGTEASDGVVVTKVAPNSQAAAQGLRPGDLITEIGRKPVTSLADAVEARDSVNSDLLLLRVVREGAGRYVALKKVG